MSLHDYRTQSESEISYYVFEDLRYQQNGNPGPEIYRYDDLAGALAKFQELPAAWTTALGMHLSERSELDLVRRTEGEPYLVTEYLFFPNWRTNKEVLHAVETVCEALNLTWQRDSKCMGQSILIPLERGLERIPDPCFAQKELRPLHIPSIFQMAPSPHTAITEAYVDGKGWVPYPILRRDVESYGWRNPHITRIRCFNVNYTDANGATGQADMSPLDLQILQERYQLRHGDSYTAQQYLYRLCDEIAELVAPAGAVRQQRTKQLRQELLQGNTNNAIQDLQAVRDYGESDRQIAMALRLLARVNSVPTSRTLDQRISNAQTRSQDSPTPGETHDKDQTKQNCR